MLLSGDNSNLQVFLDSLCDDVDVFGMFCTFDVCSGVAELDWLKAENYCRREKYRNCY